MDISNSISINAQFIVASSSGVTPPLDDYTGAQTAYSIARKLRTAYAGSAIRVRRSSDSTELDIGFDASGNLDESALTTHTGAGSGFIVKAYDQSGNGLDWVQATANKQPRIVNSGTVDKVNGKPAMFSDTTASSQDNLKATVTTSAIATAFHVFKSTRLTTNTNSAAASAYYGLTQSGGAATNYAGLVAPLPTTYVNGSSIGNTRGDLYTATTGAQVITAFTSLILTNAAWNNYNTDYTANDTYSAPDYIQETIIYNSDKSSDRAAIEANINEYYSIHGDKLLDIHIGAQTAYSISRLLRTAYTGDAIRVRRSSDDAELDIGFDGSGNLDESALTTHTGAGDGFVVKAYDQSGNSNDWVQAIANLQPRIVSSGTVDKVNSKPAMWSDATGGSQDVLTATLTGSATTTAFHVYKNTRSTGCVNAGDSSNFYGLILSSASTNYSLVGTPSTYINGSIIGTSRTNLLDATLNIHVVNSYTSLVLNGLKWLSFNTDYIASDTYATPTYIQETIIYDSDKSANRAAIETNINDYYAIY